MSKAQANLTADVFTTGQVINMRFRFAETERMVPVKCLGVQGAKPQMVIQWTEEASDQVGSPHLGIRVQLYIVLKGVLNVAKGEIIDVADGRLPRIRVTVEKACLSVPMRKHERQDVLGQVRLGAPGDPGAYRQTKPHPMDISLGGFGLGVPDRNWQVGAELEYNLMVWAIDRKGEPDTGHPCLELNGTGTIRLVRPLEGKTNVWLGVEFNSLAENLSSSLTTWLSAKNSFSRQ